MLSVYCTSPPTPSQLNPKGFWTWLYAASSCLSWGWTTGHAEVPAISAPLGFSTSVTVQNQNQQDKVRVGWAELGFCGCAEYRTGLCTFFFCFSASNWFQGSESARLVQHPVKCAVKVVDGPPFAPVPNPSLAIPFLCIILQFCGCFSSDALHPHGSSLSNESIGGKQHRAGSRCSHCANWSKTLSKSS